MALPPGDAVNLFLWNLDSTFPSQEAVDPISKGCYFKLFNNNPGCSQYNTLVGQPGQNIQFAVNYYGYLQGTNSQIYNPSNYSEVWAADIFEFIFNLYGIPVENQYLFRYTDSQAQWYSIFSLIDGTYGVDNGYYNNGNWKFVMVKTAVGQETPTRTTITSNTTVSPEFIYPPGSTNIPQVTLTIQNGNVFQTGTYVLEIYDPTITLAYTVTLINSTANLTQLVFSASPTYPTFDFGSTIGIFTCYLNYVNTGFNIYKYNVLDNINVALLYSQITPVIIDQPNLVSEFTLTIPEGQSVTEFPAGTYNITFTDPGQGGQILTQQVILPNDQQSAPAPFLLVPNVSLSNMAIYSVEGFYTGSSTEAQFSVLNNVLVNCFLKGTKILCGTKIDNEIIEKYVEIENIAPGMLVKTHQNGFIPVKYNIQSKMINNPNNPSMHKLYIYKKDKYQDLQQDLIVTGGHPVLVDNLSLQESIETIKIWNECKTLDNKFRLLTHINNEAEIYPYKGAFVVYDLVLENDDVNKNYGIYANGLLTESIEEIYFINSKLFQQTKFD
jgi:hypothetical protein